MSVRMSAIALFCAVFVACDRSGLDVDVRAVVSDAMPTVATVEWDIATDGCAGAFVDFGTTDELGLRARAWIDDAGHARALLVGMKPERTYRYRIAEVRSGDRRFSAIHELQTGKLARVDVDVVLKVADEAGAQRRFVATSLYSSESVAVILDGDGDVVWSHRPDLGWPNHFVTRVRQARIGEWITYNVDGGQAQGLPEPDPTRAIVRVSLDGAREQVLVLPDTHHDFFELGDGTLALLKYDRREVDGHTYIGDAVVEVSPDGSERQVWTVWDYFELDPENVVGPQASWSHANAMYYDKDAGAYYVSLRNFDCIVKIDQASGEQLWVLGGERSDFALSDGSEALFHHQHQFDLVENGIVVFDNGLVETQDSRAVEYRLDPAVGLATKVWEQHADPPMFCAALGDVDRLDNGNSLVTWSSAGQIEEVSPEGEVIWRVRAELGAAFGFTLHRQLLTDVVHAEMPVPDLNLLQHQSAVSRLADPAE